MISYGKLSEIVKYTMQILFPGANITSAEWGSAIPDKFQRQYRISFRGDNEKVYCIGFIKDRSLIQIWNGTKKNIVIDISDEDNCVRIYHEPQLYASEWAISHGRIYKLHDALVKYFDEHTITWGEKENKGVSDMIPLDELSDILENFMKGVGPGYVDVGVTYNDITGTHTEKFTLISDYGCTIGFTRLASGFTDIWNVDEKHVFISIDEFGNAHMQDNEELYNIKDGISKRSAFILFSDITAHGVENSVMSEPVHLVEGESKESDVKVPEECMKYHGRPIKDEKNMSLTTTKTITVFNVDCFIIGNAYEVTQYVNGKEFSKNHCILNEKTETSLVFSYFAPSENKMQRVSVLFTATELYDIKPLGVIS